MNIKEIVELQNNGKKSKRKEVKLRPIQSNRQIELEYFRALKKLANAMKEEIRREILPILKEDKAEFQTDGIVDRLAAAFAVLKRKAESLAIEAEVIGESVVNKVTTLNRTRFLNSVNQAVGVNLENVLSESELSEFVKAQSQKNIGLIKSIPEEFFKGIETTVYNGVAEGKRFEQIAKELSGIKGISSNFGKLDNRVKLIARNEVSTINGATSRKRNQQLGITEGIWMTARDERVRKCHAARDGKKFDLTKGLFNSCDNKTIFPGEEINCRCIFTPVIDLGE